ncbi:cytosolic sulfotransferase 5-like [Salvia hispanica]|uniref:cytosolic sulfotransferase 5-like n=1 Tax=Salvia hispanica TaxID=49212 RepID=UPI002009CE8D|nr:cytosolic sulfotransferase 5-like [Salvia hispanica]
MEATNPDTKHNELEKQKWCIRESLYEFHGFWFTKTYLEATKEVVETFKPLPTDIILASFPKTGTTWLKALLYSITHRSSPQDDAVLTLNHPQELIPSLETNLYVRKQAPLNDDAAKQGRILATHAPHQILQHLLNSCDCKIVYVTRNPKDTLVSLWHFLQKSKDFEDDPWELEAAVDQFCDGVVPFGPYYDHVLGYREVSINMPQKVLFVTYEELKEDTRSHVRRIGEFLGCPFVGENGEEQVEKIVRLCSFEILSNQEVNKSSELPESGFPLPYNSFFRRGEVGDHLSCLGDDMIRKIDHVTKLKFHASGFHYGI